MTASDTSARLSPEREAEIAARAAHLHEYSTRLDGEGDTLAGEDVPALLAELAAVRAERDQAQADSERLRAAHFHEAARLLEDTGHDDDAVNLLDTLANGIHAEAEDASDRRRRIYIDGHGDAWLSLSHDRDIQYVGRLAGSGLTDDTTAAVRERTGSLREIGRCW